MTQLAPQTRVSVIMAAYNEGPEIGECLRAVLENSFTAFEVIVIDDASSDNTQEVLAQIADERLQVYRNKHQLGPAASLNRAIRHASGEFIFLTNADCIVDCNWISEGLLAFDSPDIIGVEGDIFYPVIPTSIRHKVPCNPFYHAFSNRISSPHTDFASGNIAFRRHAIEVLGGFNARDYANGREDTDLGWRALRMGRIVHNPRMKVEHSFETWTLRSLLRNAQRYEKDVKFFRDYGFFFFSWKRILHPHLLFFPSLLWKYRKMPLPDFAFLPAILLYVIFARFFIWRGAIRYKTFVL